MARAVKSAFTAGRTIGGSPMTQQYAKNYYVTSERKLSRKFTEAILAVKIDKQLDKEEILDSYLNVIYFGRGAYGIQTAAQAYFQKDAADLTISEAARSEEHTSELQSRGHLVCRLLLEKKKLIYDG